MEILDAETKRAIEEFNTKIKPVENAFMMYVIAYKTIGYGRMIQMINAHWEEELKERRSIFEGNTKRDLP